MDIAALLRGLPIAGLEPDEIAYLDGLIAGPVAEQWRHSVRFLAPPASHRVPFVDPVELLDFVLRHQGKSPADARTLAMAAVERMKADVAPDHWVVFFDMFAKTSPQCLPVHEVLQWLRNEPDQALLLVDRISSTEGASSDAIRCATEIPADLVDFFERAADVTARAPMFRGPDEWDKPWSLENLPAQPPPKSMIEFVPGAPWGDFDRENGHRADHPFMQWREGMRLIAQRLEQTLGEPVYYFADLDCDTDDDNVHRFLVLHWCCTYRPESPFVRYLLRISGAHDLEELKAALIDPASYVQPFEMNGAFIGMEAGPACRFTYLPPGRSRTAVILFSTIAARDHAQHLLAQRIGMRVIVVAPSDVASTEWLQQAAPHCTGWALWHLNEDTLNEPIRLLSIADELCVIADSKMAGRGFDLQLSEGAEDLLQVAIDLGLTATYHYTDGGRLSNPELILQTRGVPVRVEARRRQRAVEMTAVREIRVECDFNSSGLWDDRGRILSYDRLDLPFALVQRIAAWQRDYDDTVNPPDEASADWWRTHRATRLELARALQITVGSDIVVSVPRGESWVAIADCDQQSDDNRPLSEPAQPESASG
ncbi:MAG: hypothetical protein QE272_12145 [Nevskia sp.]|nr:hypothetical protein [Nevskia sp.]